MTSTLYYKNSPVSLDTFSQGLTFGIYTALACGLLVSAGGTWSMVKLSTVCAEKEHQANSASPLFYKIAKWSALMFAGIIGAIGLAFTAPLFGLHTIYSFQIPAIVLGTLTARYVVVSIVQQARSYL